MAKKKDRIPVSSTEGLTERPFAGLAALKAKLAPAASDASPPPETSPAKAAAAPPPGKVVVRREKKGRGGKVVTRIQGLPPESLEALAAELKRSLGCGASVEDEDLLLQGAQERRAAEALKARGFRRVIVGT